MNGIAGATSSSYKFLMLMGYATWEMLDCWQAACASGTASAVELLQSTCRDPADVVDCHPCNLAIEDHIQAHGGTFEDALCTHPSICKTGRCAGYGYQTTLFQSDLQNNGTDHSDGLLSLMSDVSRTKTHAGWYMNLSFWSTASVMCAVDFRDCG